MLYSFEVTIMVIGVSISWALNSSYWSSVFFGCCDSVFNTFAVHGSLLLMVSQLSCTIHLNLEAV